MAAFRVASFPATPALAFVALVCLLTGCGQSRDGYFHKGNIFYSRGQYQDASINFRNAIRKDARFAEGYQQLGLSDFAQGKVGDAAADLTRAQQLAPQNQKILEDLADVTFNRYLLSGRSNALYDSVTGMVAVILKRDPKSVAGLRLRASLLYGDGKLQDAIAAYQHVNALSPDDPAVLLPLADALRLADRNSEA